MTKEEQREFLVDNLNRLGSKGVWIHRIGVLIVIIPCLLLSVCGYFFTPVFESGDPITDFVGRMIFTFPPLPFVFHGLFLLVRWERLSREESIVRYVIEG
jgi:hypothetical protein